MSALLLRPPPPGSREHRCRAFPHVSRLATSSTSLTGRAEKIAWITLILASERRNDHRHAAMYVVHQLVGVCGQKAEGAQPLVGVARSPVFQMVRRISLHGKAALDPLLLKEVVDRQQKTTRVIIAERGSDTTASALVVICLRAPSGSLHQSGIGPPDNAVALVRGILWVLAHLPEARSVRNWCHTPT
jgi:hypothetical protein